MLMSAGVHKTSWGNPVTPFPSNLMGTPSQTTKDGGRIRARLLGNFPLSLYVCPSTPPTYLQSPPLQQQDLSLVFAPLDQRGITPCGLVPYGT